MEQDKGGFERLISGAKETLTVTREMVVLVVLFLLFGAPSLISGRLEKAGFVKANIAGFEWEKRLLKTAEATGEAQLQVNYIQQRIDTISAQLVAAVADVQSVQAKNEILDLTVELDSLAGVARTAREELRRSFRAQQNLIEDARAEVTPPPAAGWGVAISGDKRLDQAHFEVGRARRAGFPHVSIYSRQKWFRTVVEFSSQADAQAALPLIRTELEESAYVVELREWCGKAEERTAEGVVVCVKGE